MSNISVVQKLILFGTIFTPHAVKLDYHVALIVPSTIGNVPCVEGAFLGYVEWAKVEMCKIFGAADVKRGEGVWQGIAEDNAIVTSFFDDITQDQYADFSALVFTVQAVMKQQCMAVVINGKMELWDRDNK